VQISKKTLQTKSHDVLYVHGMIDTYRQNFDVKFQAIAEKTAKNLRRLLFRQSW